jgi:hypothetical protein
MASYYRLCVEFYLFKEAENIKKEVQIKNRIEERQIKDTEERGQERKKDRQQMCARKKKERPGFDAKTCVMR